MQIDFIHSASAIGTWTVQKEFEIATLADFLCCCWIWTGQSFLPSSVPVLEFDSLFKVQVAWSFSHIRQVAPTAQKRASHAGLCHAVLVYFCFFLAAFYMANRVVCINLHTNLIIKQLAWREGGGSSPSLHASCLIIRFWVFYTRCYILLIQFRQYFGIILPQTLVSTVIMLGIINCTCLR